MKKQDFIKFISTGCILFLLSSCSIIEGDSSRRTPVLNQKFLDNDDGQDGAMIENASKGLSKLQNKNINIFDNFFSNSSNDEHATKRHPEKNVLKNKSDNDSEIDQVFKNGEKKETPHKNELGIKNETVVEKALESSKHSNITPPEPTKKPEHTKKEMPQHKIHNTNTTPPKPTTTAIQNNQPVVKAPSLPVPSLPAPIDIKTPNAVVAPATMKVPSLPAPIDIKTPNAVVAQATMKAPSLPTPNLPAPIDIKAPSSLPPTSSAVNVKSSVNALNNNMPKAGCNPLITNLDVATKKDSDLCQLNFYAPTPGAARPKDTFTGAVVNFHQNNALNFADNSKEASPIDSLSAQKMQIISSTQATTKSDANTQQKSWKNRIFNVKNKISGYFSSMVQKAEGLVKN